LPFLRFIIGLNSAEITLKSSFHSYLEGNKLLYGARLRYSSLVVKAMVSLKFLDMEASTPTLFTETSYSSFRTLLLVSKSNMLDIAPTYSAPNPPDDKETPSNNMGENLPLLGMLGPDPEKGRCTCTSLMKTLDS